MSDKFLVRLRREAADILFPKYCFGCGREGGFLCHTCENTLVFMPPACVVCGKMHFDIDPLKRGRTCVPCRKKTHIYSFLSPFSYGSEPVTGIIHSMKYERVRDLDEVLGRLLALYVKRYGVAFFDDSIMIPVPLHLEKKRFRGFNQSFLIADKLIKMMEGTNLSRGVRLADVLKKIRKTPPQAELMRDMRLKNLEKAFAVADPSAVKDKIVYLIDDIKTTGATLEEAASVLKSAGASRVCAITLAH